MHRPPDNIGASSGFFPESFKTRTLDPIQVPDRLAGRRSTLVSIDFDQIQPVVITAPTARNGVTLLQRLFNSSGQIIVYGENAHFAERLPGLVYEAQGIHLAHHQVFEATRQRFLNETTEFWSSSLWPDTQMYWDLAVESFRRFVILYQKCSEDYGFERWGIKHPFSSVIHLDRFLTLLPAGRFIYIYRNLFDVARSAKARKFAKIPADFQKLAATWQDSLRVVSAAQEESLMVIKYEDLVEDPAAWISRIETFTGITGIDPDVMNRKYNTFKGEAAAGYSSTEYIVPAPLTEDEIALLRETAGDVLAALNYTSDQPAEPVVVAG